MANPSSSQPDSQGAAQALRQLPKQRWRVFPPQVHQAQQLAITTQLSPLLAQVLINRGIYTPEQAWLFLDPETQQLPSPLDEFPDLALSLELLVKAINQAQKIAICGDYDADGMTSTALLIRALTYLGADVQYAIPSRMQEGYGINERIVEEFHREGVTLILTVDNGIAAYTPIARARELGLAVIVTDHHDIPEQLPPANGILNPKLLLPTSPYRGLAGVGVAYVLAVCLAQALQKTQALTAPLLELFTLGTIADLAPLTGVNRRWVRRGLALLPKSRLPGIQALIEVAGLGQSQNALKPEAIGFRLGPRINAVGRIADPQIVIDMLTTEDVGIALQRALQCEEANTLRQRLCEIIEEQAVAWCEEQQQTGKLDLLKERVLIVVQPEWHHGVIGIVASRLVERYGVPVFIGTYEDKAQKEIRGSARGIPEFNVFDALQACDDLLNKYGGHRAAGGFSLPVRNLRQFKTRLSNFACLQLQPEQLKPLVTIDVQANLADIDLALFEQIDRLHPCGIENGDPIFWTANVAVVDQQIIGKDRKHLKLTLAQTHPQTHHLTTIRTVAWRWAEYYPLPTPLDIAYKLRLNEWKGERSVELELSGARLPKETSGLQGIPAWPGPALDAAMPAAVPTVSTAPPRVDQSGTPPLDIAMGPVTRKLAASPMDLATAEVGLASSVVSAVEIEADADQSDTATTGQSLSTGGAVIGGEQPRSQPMSSVVAERPVLRSLALPNLGSTEADIRPSLRPSTPQLPTETSLPAAHPPVVTHASIASSPPPATYAEFFYGKRRYVSTIDCQGLTRELKIQNAEGHILWVQMAERQGLLQLPDSDPVPVNLSEPHYFNLLRAGLNALELKQKTQLILQKDELLLEKDELLSEKDGHIEKLTQQVKLLEEKISQLSAEKRKQFKVLQTELSQQESAIQHQEAHIAQLQTQMTQPDIAPPNPAEIKQQVREAVGDRVWFCLQGDSQKDLCAAYKNYAIIQNSGADPHIADYSEAGIRLSFAVEREVVQPFFKDLYTFLLTQGSSEIGGVQLGPTRKYTLGMLPSLLAEQWQTFKKDALLQPEPAQQADLLFQSKASYVVNSRDRKLLNDFYQQWEHPMSVCFSQKGTQSAACLDQISRLRNIAAHAESFLYEWHYDLLKQLIMGGQQHGLFRQIYGG